MSFFVNIVDLSGFIFLLVGLQFILPIVSPFVLFSARTLIFRTPEESPSIAAVYVIRIVIEAVLFGQSSVAKSILCSDGDTILL